MRSELEEKRNYLSRKMNSLNPLRQKGMVPNGGTKRVRKAEIGRYARYRLGRAAEHSAIGAGAGALVGHPLIGAALGFSSGVTKPGSNDTVGKYREDRLKRALKTTKRRTGGVITKNFAGGNYAVRNKDTGQVKTRQGVYENKLITRNGWKNA